MKYKSLKNLAVLAITGTLSTGVHAEESDGQIGVYHQTMESVNKPVPNNDGQDPEKGFESGTYSLFFAASGASANGSALDYTYGGGGCMYQNSTISDGDFDMNLQLPDGHFIRGYRYFWNDTTASSSNAALFQFDGQGGLTVLENHSSTGDTGFGSFFEDFPGGDILVDNTAGAYVIRFNSSENGPGQEMCGVRFVMVAP